MAAAGGGAAAAGRAYSFKVVLLGEGCVGKTSLVLRYCENKFNDKHITTLQVRSGEAPTPLRLRTWPPGSPGSRGLRSRPWRAVAGRGEVWWGEADAPRKVPRFPGGGGARRGVPRPGLVSPV